MRPTHQFMPRPALLAAALTAIVAAQAPAQAQINDRIRGTPSEANHFIETPRGWQHPKTAWGEPDIQAQLNQMQAAGIPLERCASSYRAALPPGAAAPGGPAGGVGAPAACDMNKVWLTDEEYAKRMEEFRARVDASRQFAEQGNLGRAMMTGLTDPNIPQRQTTLIMSPANGLLPPLTAEGKRRALLAKSDWALPGETIAFDGPRELRQLGPLHHARYAVVDDAVPLQRRLRDSPGAGLRDLRARDDPRSARHSDGRTPAARVRGQAVARRVAWPLGRQHARRRDDELHRKARR